VTWQPEPEQSWPVGPASDDGPGLPDDRFQARPAGRRRGGRRLGTFALLLAAGLAGLAVSAVGVAHNVLPRQFTVGQRRQIAAWELNRRWRALPAGVIFADSVSYTVPSADLNSSRSLTLQARLLSISPNTSCAAAMPGPAAQTLSQHGCTAAMRATYVDSSGSLIATVTVAVLPDTAAQRAVVEDLADDGYAVGAGPYVILSTAGFADGRHHVRLASDQYLDDEMSSLTSGLADSAEGALGKPLPPLVCPGAPGC
jgi:hypothetical protein